MSGLGLHERLFYRKNQANPQALLTRFIALMQQWEENCIRTQSFDRDGLAEIFAIYCVPKTRKGRQRVGFRNPPEYSAEHEKIVNCVVNGKVARLFTETKFEFSRFKWFCYVCKLTADGWKIDEKTVVLHDDKVEGHVL